MIEDYFKPLTLQIDSGFGATADSFYYAAQALEDNQDSKYGFGIGGGKLPLLYLYRHSIELYLKSVITFLYRINKGDIENYDDQKFPQIKDNGKDKKIFNVHSVSSLFQNYLEMLNKYKSSIKSRNGYDWFEIPEEIFQFIEKIEEYDKSSTMFRYPISMDSNLDYEKSTFKKFLFDDEKNEVESTTKSKIFLLIQNDKNEIVESYVSDNDAVTEIHDVLKKLAKQLSGLHFGLKADLIR